MPESFKYTSEEEMFQLAAKVNAFCELTPETFDPTVHVADARELVRLIAPRVKASSVLRLDLWRNSKSSKMAGATEHGTVSITEGGKNQTKTFGVKEFRIGNYVVTGRSPLTSPDSLAFEHFWERTPGSSVEEEKQVARGISFIRRSKEPVAIYDTYKIPRSVLIARTAFGVVTVVNKTIWKK